MPRDLHDRVIAITGASSGIGAATALACAAAGMHVALGARRTDKLQEVARQVEALRRRALVIACDVTRDDDVEQFISKTHREFGRLDAAFANAGYGIFAPVAETPIEAVREIFETNLFGTVRVIRAVIPIFRRQKHGHLLICSSAASKIGVPMYGVYSATKAAQDCIGGALRVELAAEGVDVSTIHPIGTSSEFTQSAREFAGGEVRPNTPAHMQQTAEHVAQCIVKCLRRPRPEVWPYLPVRFGLAINTAFPRLGHRQLTRHMRRLRAPTQGRVNKETP